MSRPGGQNGYRRTRSEQGGDPVAQRVGVCLSTQKLYGTWGDPVPVQEELIAMAEARDDCEVSIQEAAGHRIIRLRARGMQAPDFPRSRHGAPAAKPRSTPVSGPSSAPRKPPEGGRPGRSQAARIAVDVLPPVITRAVRRSRARRRGA